MKNVSLVIASIFLSSLGLSTLASPAGAAVLIFSNMGIGLNQPIPQDYGDNLVNLPGGVGNPNTSYTYGTAHGITPNVTVAYGTDPAVPSVAPVLWAGMGDLTNVLNPVSSATITLTADPGYIVQLYGFDFAGYAGLDWTVSLIKVLVNGQTVFSQSNVTAPGVGHNSLSSMTGATPIVGETVQIVFDTQVAAGTVGIDNIDFAQSTPEPTSAAIVALFAGATLARRVRRGR